MKHYDDTTRLVSEIEDPDEAIELTELWELVGEASPESSPNPTEMDRVRSAISTAARKDAVRGAARKNAGSGTGSGAVRWYVAAALGALLMVGAAWLGRDTVTRASPGADVTVTLRDGSTARLAPGSELRTPGLFGSRRRAELQGEAWFEIEPSPTPFLVSTGSVHIRVLGTSFMVRSWPGILERVYLDEGSVALSSPDYPDAAASLSPGKSLTLVDGEFVSDAAYDRAAALAWLTGDFLFRNEPLIHVVREIERRFDVRIRIADDTAAATRVNGAFRHPEEAETILRDLSTYLQLRYRAVSDGYEILGGSMD